MYLNPLILDGHYVGFHELVRGNPQDAIQYIQRLVTQCSANEETTQAAFRYMLMYATYSMPQLPQSMVAQLCQAFAWAIEDPASRNLISERLNVGWRRENSTQLASAPGHPNIFCVSIPRFVDRQRELLKSARRFGIENIEFIGVDAHILEETPSWVQFDATLGTTANILGHRMVWEQICARGISSAIVLEDDITVCSSLDFRPFLDQLSQLDLVFFNNRVVPNYGQLRPLSERTINDELVPVWFGCGTDGYLVTHRGASKLLELFRFATDALDVQIMSHSSDQAADEDEKLTRCRAARNSEIRLDCRRTYPFLVEHPAYGYSSAANRVIRNFCPGLWAGEDRP